MKTRNIPFGYMRDNGKITLHMTESGTVQAIYTAYLNGQSLLQIADSLNKKGTEYLPGVTGWNKARIMRILEDTRYLGNDTYPPMVDGAVFEQVKTIKAERNTQKDLDRSADILNLCVPVCCEQCGKPMQRLHDNRTTHKEKWVCNACGVYVKIADDLLLTAVIDTINHLIDDPRLICHIQVENETPTEILRLRNEIGQMLDSAAVDKEGTRNRIFEYASLLYGRYDSTERITEQIRAALQSSGSLSSYNGELVQQIASAITPHPDKTVTLTLKNGQQIRKETSHADSHSQDGASDTAHHTAVQCA